MKSGAIALGALLFGFIAIAHLERLFFPYNITIGNTPIPLWGSAIVFIITGALCGYLFGACKKSCE